MNPLRTVVAIAGLTVLAACGVDTQEQPEPIESLDRGADGRRTVVTTVVPEWWGSSTPSTAAVPTGAAGTGPSASRPSASR